MRFHERLIDLAREYALAGSNKANLHSLGDQILRTKNIGVDLGLLLLSIGAVAYCISFVQSGAVPSMIAWLGLAAGILSAIGILIPPLRHSNRRGWWLGPVSRRGQPG